MKIKIERKSPYTHQIIEVENQTLIAEPHFIGREVWCAIEYSEGSIRIPFRTPMEGALEISAI